MDNMTFPPQLPEMEPEDGKSLPEMLPILNYICGATTINRQTLAADLMEFAATCLKNLDEHKQKIVSLEQELLELREMSNGEVEASPTEENLEELNLPESLNSEHTVEVNGCPSDDDDEECIQPLFASITWSDSNNLADEVSSPEVTKEEPVPEQEVFLTEEKSEEDEKQVEVESVQQTEITTCHGSSPPEDNSQSNSNTDSRLAKKKRRKRQQRKAKRQMIQSSSEVNVAADNCTSDGQDEVIEPLLASVTRMDRDLADEHCSAELSREDPASTPDVFLSEEKPLEEETQSEDFLLPEPVNSEHTVEVNSCPSDDDDEECIQPLFASITWSDSNNLADEVSSPEVTKEEPVPEQEVFLTEEKSEEDEQQVEVESVQQTEITTCHGSSPPEDNSQSNSNTDSRLAKKKLRKRQQRKAKRQMIQSSSEVNVAADNCTSDGQDEVIEPLLASVTRMDSNLSDEHCSAELSREDPASTPDVLLSEEKPLEEETHLEDFLLPEPVNSEHTVEVNSCSSEEYAFIWPLLSSFPSWYKRKQLAKKPRSSLVTKEEPASAQDVPLTEEKRVEEEKQVEVESVHNHEEQKEITTCDSSAPLKDNNQSNASTDLRSGKKVATRREEKKAKKQKKRKGSRW